MPFVQDSTAPISDSPSSNNPVTAPIADEVKTTSETIADPTNAAPKVGEQGAIVNSSTDKVTDSKVEPKSEVGEVDVKPESKANTVTIAKSETVTKPVGPKQVDPSSFLIWLPLFAAMALWLFLRGRNQAAERSRKEALLAEASKKAKKSARSQQSEFRAEQPSDVTSKASGDRSKGNSKKNKKDKQQLKKRQNANSGAASSKGNKDSTAVSGVSENKRSNSAESVSPISAAATGSAKLPATKVPAVADASPSLDPKRSVPAVQQTKAIFEPLRKVTAPIPTKNDADDIDSDDESDDRSFASMRNRRSNQTAPVITTPAKVSGGRFEKLNLPAANAGLGASFANRWPAEAAKPISPVSFSDANTATRTTKSDAPSPPPAARTPLTARGLGAFVKVAKTTETTPTKTSNAAETQSESSGT